VYFVTPSHSVAVIPKAGSASLALAILRSFYPHKSQLMDAAHYPAGRNAENTLWHSFVPQEKTPTKPVVAVIRDPVSRFCSACAFMGLSVADAVLDSLEHGQEIEGRRGRKFFAAKNPHFRRQAPLATAGASLFRFEHIDAAAELLGLAVPLLNVNKSRQPKIDLTPSQVDRVLGYYADDHSLYASL
jgi:hypothetical protein